jgi:hypothetical protein
VLRELDAAGEEDVDTRNQKDETACRPHVEVGHFVRLDSMLETSAALVNPELS